MEVDVLLDAFGATWRDVRDAAGAAADAGFAGLWTFDHVDGRVYDASHVLESWTLLSALAATVPDVVIGPLVLNVANRPPGVLAAMIATLQEVAGGRLVVGLGAGARPGTRYAREQHAIGQPTYGDAERRAQVEWYIDDVRGIWSSPGFLRPDPAPPFVVGARGPKMAELAGRVADGINVRAEHPQLSDLVAVARDAHERAAHERAAHERAAHERAVSERDRADPGRFLVTVLAEFDERWLAPDSPDHTRLVRLGVDRVVLIVPLPFDRDRLAAAGDLLHR